MAELHPDVPPRHCFDRLGKAVRELKAKTVIELGTNFGFSTREFATALRETGGRLYSIDINPPIDDWPRKWALGTKLPIDHLTFVQHDSLTLDLEPFAKEPVDILFIDDRHTYRHLLQVLRKYAPLVRAGGRIFVDDPTHCDGAPTPELNCGASVLWAVALWCREVNLPFTCWTEDPYGLIEITVAKPIPKCPAIDARIFGITGVATVLNSLHLQKDADS